MRMGRLWVNVQTGEPYANLSDSKFGDLRAHHRRKHSNNRPFQCVKYENTFTTKAERTSHGLSHSREGGTEGYHGHYTSPLKRKRQTDKPSGTDVEDEATAGKRKIQILGNRADRPCCACRVFPRASAGRRPRGR